MFDVSGILTLANDYLQQYFWQILGAMMVVYIIRSWIQTASLKNAPPTVNGFLPILGVIFRLYKNPIDLILSLSKKYGDVFTLKILWVRLTFLVGPEAVDQFYRAPDEQLSQKEAYKFTIPVFGRGIVYDSADLKVFQQQLKFVGHALSGKKMRTYVDMMVAEAQEFFSTWGDEGVIDLRESMSQLIILTASRALLGREVRENLHEKVAGLYSYLDLGMTPISVFFPYAPLPAHKKRDWARKEMGEVFAKVIQNRRKSGHREDDFLQVLIEAEYKDGTMLSDDEITGILIVALFAGQHTSSITATWTGLLMLADKKRHIPRLLREQEAIVKQYGDELTHESVSAMSELYNAMKEALRMYPPLIMLMRKAIQPLQSKEFVIPAGDMVITSPAANGRLPSVFSHPDEYDPQRYDPDRAEDKKRPFCYQAFGGGRHGCMGENFAFLQVRTIWSILLRNFDMELVGDVPEADYAAMVVGPMPPCTVRYRRRKETIGRALKFKAGTTPSAKAAQAPGSKAGSSAPAKAAGSSSSSLKKFTREEVAKHDSAKDLWLIIDGKVYDLTTFVEDHPGGESILNNAGGDASEGFRGDQHPFPKVDDMLEEYLIGEVSN